MFKINRKNIFSTNNIKMSSNKPKVKKVKTSLPTPIGRIGGKSRLIKRLVPLFPKEEEIDTFLDLFVGGGSVFLGRPSNPNIREIINDLDEEIYLSFKALKEDNDNIQANIVRKLSEEEFYKIRDEYYKENKKEPIKIIARLKSSFFNRGKNFTKSKGEFYPINTNFALYKDRLANTEIYNKTFQELVSENCENPKAFFFLDPPYENKKKTDYKDYILPSQVLEEVKKIKGKFLITYNKSDEILATFKDYNITEITTTYANTQNIEKREKVELVIKNY